MYRKLLLLLMLGLAATKLLPAQVTIALQVPPVGVMQKTQLWNMALVYAGNNSIDVYVSLTLLSTKDNQPLLRATSRPLILTKGTKQINATDASPVQYNYMSPIFNVDRDPNGFLPVGNFKACYTVFKRDDSGEPLAEDCIPVEVQPLSPPQLNLPADTSVIETAYPQFNWLPPSPLNLFSNLTYDILVVEVLPGQTSYESIQKNMPVYNISHYKDMVHLYPASGKALDTGRVYAWRVVAKNEDEFVAQSEVWTFRLASQKTVSPAPAGDNYILLKKSNEASSGINIIKTGRIGIKYYSFDKAHETTVNFLSSDGQLLRQVQEKLAYGDNFLDYTLGSQFQKGKSYRVEITDLQHNIYTASFTINQ